MEDKYLLISMKNKILISIIGLFLGYFASAQIYTVHNLYPENMFLYNPAFAGSANRFAGFVDYKHHLAAISEAPRTGIAGIHTPIFGNMGLGVLIKTERVGLLETNMLRADYAFRTKLSDSQTFALGFNGGLMQRNLNSEGVVVLDDTDPTILGDYFKKNIVFFGGGLDYNLKNFNFSASMPVIYRSGVNLFIRTQVYSAYNFQFGQWNLKPAVSALLAEKNFEAYHAHLTLGFEQKFWLRASYKSNKSLVGSVGMALGKMGIAYAYETNNNALAYIGGATHEISLSYGLFDVKKPKPEPIDTVLVPETQEYVHKLKRMIENETYDQFVKAGNFAFYNEIVSLTDSMFRGTPPLVDKDKNKHNILNENLINNNTVTNATAPGTNSESNVPKSNTKTGIELLDKGLSFTEGSAMLNADGRAYLDNVAILLKEHPEMKILIYGHSCDLGSKQTNLRISKQRAETVRYYLTINGVPQNQIQSEGIADMQQLVPNTSEKNRLKNRRVSFVIIK